MQTATNIPLGLFELHEPIGHGAAGEVWRGSHRPSGADVAIKVVTSALAREDSARRALQREIQAIARMAHPGIIELLDRALLGLRSDGGSERTRRAVVDIRAARRMR